jgi:hypothetical protein
MGRVLFGAGVHRQALQHHWPENPLEARPERSGGNPKKRQQRDVGQPERSGGNPKKRQQRDVGQPERSAGNPKKR